MDREQHFKGLQYEWLILLAIAIDVQMLEIYL